MVHMNMLLFPRADPPPKVASESRRQLRRRRYGVYDVTCEDGSGAIGAVPLPWPLRMHALRDGLAAIHGKIYYLWRLLADAIRLAPLAFAAYIVSPVLQGVYEAAQLHWLLALFDALEASAADKASPAFFRSLAVVMLLCAVIRAPVDYLNDRSLEVLSMRFRAHFIPQLIRASMRVDLLSIQDLYDIVPARGYFGSEFPGGNSLRKLNVLIYHTVHLACHAFVLLRAISRKSSPERKILLCACIGSGIAQWFFPPGRLNLPGYIYWPNNPHFKKMKSLYELAFARLYRAGIMLDGIASSIEAEYRRSAVLMGNVEDVEPTPFSTLFKRDWYWDFLSSITMNYPTVIYVLIFQDNLSLSSIASMMLLEQAIRTISSGVQYNALDAPTLSSICANAEWLYDGIDYEGTMREGTEPYPRLSQSSDAGMKISFRHVSLRYPGADHEALSDVSFDILPGELVLIVGANGSGKSTTLKLLARLFDPTAGQVLVDDVPVVDYDGGALRAAMAFQSQSPIIYPGSVRDNITCGIPAGRAGAQAEIEAAAQLGECAEWIGRLEDGYDTALQSLFDITLGWREGAEGILTEALKEALAQHEGNPVSISDGEKQRLAAARTLLRIRTCPTRLVVADEATSALDPVAERAILKAFRDARAGKTMVFVTHRFHHLAHEADRILCMENGRIVESGTHDELMRVNGPYAALYRAQTEQGCD